MAWAPDYVTADDLADFVDIDDDDQVADDAEELGRAVSAASRAVDLYCRRQFGQTAAVEARQYQPRRAGLYGEWVADIDDLFDTTGLLVDGVAPTMLPTLWPLRAKQTGRPWTRMAVASRSVVTITAKWGWPAVPATIAEATLLQASRLFKRRDAPFGVAGSPQSGGEMRLLERLDPDVMVMVKAYRRDARPQ